MKTLTVLTPANIEIEYRLAGAGSRLAAFVVDFTIQLLLGLLLSALVLFGIYGYRFNTLGNMEGYALGFLIIAWFVIYFCYFVFCEMAMNGQSIGKKIFGLRVIRDNGLPLGLQQSLIRGLFRAVIDVVYIGLFAILFSEKHKRIGDMVAGTVVIAEHYDSTTTPLSSTNMPNTKRVGMEHLKHLILTSKERDLLHSYMARRLYLPDDTNKRLQKKWAKYLSQKWHIEDLEINEEILAALLQLNEVEY